MTENVLRQFNQSIQPYIRALLTEKVGIGLGDLRISEASPGKPTTAGATNCDRFKLIIPYAGQQITWTVVFNVYRPRLPPDFLFDDESFMVDPDYRYLQRNVRGLAEWNPQDPRALLKVISDLLALYKAHQVNQISNIERLKFEYSSLVDGQILTNRDIEVKLIAGGEGGATFLIRLQVGLGEEGEPAAILTVTFHPPLRGEIRTTTRLLLSPKAERALEDAGGRIMLPTQPQGGYLMDYVPQVTQLLNQRATSAASSFENRHQLLSELINLFPFALHEFDSSRFSSISFLLSWNDFYFMVHIRVPNNFPRQKPKLEFQSVYHAVFGRPFHAEMDFGYDNRWTINKIAEKIAVSVRRNVADFQAMCLQTLT